MIFNNSFKHQIYNENRHMSGIKIATVTVSEGSSKHYWFSLTSGLALLPQSKTHNLKDDRQASQLLKNLQQAHHNCRWFSGQRNTSISIHFFKSFSSTTLCREPNTQWNDFFVLFENCTCYWFWHFGERKVNLKSVWENIFRFVKCVKKITVMAKIGHSSKAMLRTPCLQSLGRINSL